MPHSEKEDSVARREREALLDVHRKDREAHFARDVGALLETVPDPQIYVRAGKIQYLTHADQRATFAAYFADTRFLEWDDAEEPIVNVSQDGTMGYMVERVRVRRIVKSAEGTEEERLFVYAGITVYEKREGAWFKAANASTFE